MKTICSFDQHEMGLTDPGDHEITWTRRAARAVLKNEKGQIALMHFRTNGFYKLPGGGIDDGETVEQALRREVMEEAGYEITDIRELGIIEEERYFAGMHQTSYCFMARAAKFVGTSLTEKEAAGGMELVRVDTLEDAMRTITSAESTAVRDEDESGVGLKMMIQRECAILAAAQ